MSDTDTEGKPSAQETAGMVRLDLDNEAHARALEESSSGVLDNGRVPRLIEFVVVDGELWTDDYRITGG